MPKGENIYELISIRNHVSKRTKSITAVVKLGFWFKRSQNEKVINLT